MTESEIKSEIAKLESRLLLLRMASDPDPDFGFRERKEFERMQFDSPSLKRICYPSTGDRERNLRYASIILDGEKIAWHRTHCGMSRSSLYAPDESPVNFYDCGENSRWADRFTLCRNCGRVGENRNNQKKLEDLIDEVFDHKQQLDMGDYGLISVKLNKETIDRFNSIFNSSSAFAFEVKACDRRGCYRENILQRGSRMVAELEWFEYEKYLKKFNPEAWRIATYDRDMETKRLERERVDKLLERNYAEQEARRNENRKKSFVLARNKKKLNNKNLRFIARIGMASKLNQTCTA